MQEQPLAVGVDEEVERLNAAVQNRRERIADLEVERESLRSDLDRFSWRFHARVGSLLIEQERIALSTREYVRRIELLREQQGRDGLRRAEDAVANEFQDERRELDEDAAQAAEAQSAHRAEEAREAQYADRAVRRQRLRELYHEEARHFHPDLARDDVERDRFHRHMVAVNGAYHAGDLEQLERLAASPPREHAPEGESRTERRRRLRTQVMRLDESIRIIIQDIGALSASPTCEAWRATIAAEANGRDYLGELVQRVERELAEQRAELDGLVIAYRQLVSESQHD